MEVTAGWTEGKPWEIAWGELRWEGEAVAGNSLGRALLGRSEMEARQGGRTGNSGKELGESSVGKERLTEKQSCWHGFSGQISFPNPGPWDMHSFVGRERD